MQIQEILIIKNANESYGISTDNINQISRVPSLMPLPLRPKGTRGLCAVSGNIVSMLDLNLLLNMSEIDLTSSASRLISLNDELSSNALLVSEVYNTVNIDESNIEYLDNKDDPIIAIYKYKKSLIQIVCIETLISSISKIQIQAKDINNGKVKTIITKEEESTKFLIFAMQNENFALNIDYLREIILSDVNYTDIAGSSDELLGLITLREKLITVIDLRKYYGFKSTNDEKNRILIASLNGKNVGLLVDCVIDIKSIANKNIEYMKDSFEDNMVSGVIHDNNSLISFFDHNVLETIFSINTKYIDLKNEEHEDYEQKDSEQKDEEQMEVIIFKLLGKEYSFDVNVVAEIIDVVKSTNVAFSDTDIDGIINIRGQIVSIVSLFKKLNIQTIINKNSKIIVCDIKENKVGFVVDSISDIIDIQKDEINNQDDKLFKNILHLNNGERLVLYMDIEKLVLDKEK